MNGVRNPRHIDDIAVFSPEMVVDQIIADAPDQRWTEIQALCGEHDVLSPLRPLVRRAAPIADDG